MTTAIATPDLSVSDTTASSLYWDGFDAYCEGQSLEDMPTDEQQRGWWFANKCQGVAEMDTDDYADDILDREFWARGGW